MKYGSRIDGSNYEPVVTIRGQGPVQRFSQFPDMPQAPRGGTEHLHQGPFSRSLQVPEQKEFLNRPSQTTNMKARYAEMRRRMHKVMPDVVEAQTDASVGVAVDGVADDRSQLQFFEPIQFVSETVIENPTPITIIEANEAFKRSLEENNSSVIVNSVLVDDDSADNFGNTIPVDAITPDPDWDEVQAYVDPLTPKEAFRF